MVSEPPVRLAHAIFGPKDGPCVLLLHGFPLDRTMWRPQAEALADEGYRVVTPDLRGHGQSPAPAAVATMTAMSRDIFALADALEIERFLLGGFSLGGYVAMQAYATHPDRIQGLLLCDTRADPDTEEGRKGRLALVEKVRTSGAAPVVEAMLPKLLTEKTHQTRPELVATVRRTILATSPSGIVNALLGMAQRPDQRPLMPKIRIPTLVLVGSEDTLTPVATSQAIADAVPGAKLRIIGGAAHLAPLEDPEVVHHAILDWLPPGQGSVARSARTGYS